MKWVLSNKSDIKDFLLAACDGLIECHSYLTIMMKKYYLAAEEEEVATLLCENIGKLLDLIYENRHLLEGDKKDV